jgi:formate dehydrogenase iron-sulfur subunit
MHQLVKPLRDEGEGLLDALLQQQGELTAVEKFSQRYAESDGDRYRDLLPLSTPGTGEQYAFEVDLDACSGCKACVTACHSMNGLDEGESWRDVGSLVSDESYAPVAVTSACHHCADPACADGCPTLAYEKDPASGIVRHLDDQCIGCGYCEMKCPYGVPKYNDARGIVRKCDMCHSRLAEGEAPACVAACPNGGIRIRVVQTAAIPTSGEMLPGAYDSAYTRPSTIFKTERDLGGRRAADAGQASATHDHLPLVWMLTLSQFSVGLGIAAALAGSRSLAIAAALVGLGGMFASVTHLGRPGKAWRAFLGLRRSWLSREIVAFGLWMPSALAAAALPIPTLLWSAVATGLLAVFCSAMVYIDTRRPSWRAARTLPSFFGAVAAGTLAGFVPPLGAIAYVAFWFERRRYFRAMTVLKMPGN